MRVTRGGGESSEPPPPPRIKRNPRTKRNPKPKISALKHERKKEERKNTHRPAKTHGNSNPNKMEIKALTSLNCLLPTLQTRSASKLAPPAHVSLAFRDITPLHDGSAAAGLSKRDFRYNLGVVEHSAAVGANERSVGIIEVSGVRTRTAGACVVGHFFPLQMLTD